MINDDDRDYAEEHANLADMRAEAESEAAHERLVTRLVTELRALGTASHLDARETVARLAEEIELRIAPNAHRYELLARRQHIALLAATVADGIEAGVGYDLRDAAQRIADGYVATHVPVFPVDLLGRALRDGVARVLCAVQSVLDTDEQDSIDAREQTDLDETHRSLR